MARRPIGSRKPRGHSPADDGNRRVRALRIMPRFRLFMAALLASTSVAWNCSPTPGEDEESPGGGRTDAGLTDGASADAAAPVTDGEAADVGPPDGAVDSGPGPEDAGADVAPPED